MAGTTTNYAFRYPGEGDPPDGALQIQNLATDVDTYIHGIDAGSRAQTAITTTGTLASTVYPKAHSLRFRVQAPGGAAGGSPATSTTQTSGGGGGGGGGYTEVVVAVSAITFPVTCTLGAAGTGVSGAAGNAGGNVTVVDNAAVTIASVVGGSGGQILTAASGAYGTNNGGVGGTVTTGGTLKVPGQPGTAVTKSVVLTTGGCVPGNGGNSVLGLGGAANAAGAGGSGSVGTGFGSGGGGSWAPQSSGATTGANGAPAIVLIDPIY